MTARWNECRAGEYFPHHLSDSDIIGRGKRSHTITQLLPICENLFFEIAKNQICLIYLCYMVVLILTNMHVRL